MLRHAIALCLLALPAAAAPESWRLDTARSTVGFTYQIAQGDNRGTMPVTAADIRLDMRNLPASTVAVTLDARAARAGFVLATQAMRGPQVLDTGRHPVITFHSTRITGTPRAARIEGKLTARGVTRPVTLVAGLYRAVDTDPAAIDSLTVLLTGEIDRHDFGASGFADLVGPTIALRIVARIERP
ncbi:YceI family protein [Roseovarius autotrophicus]|uniref:YceI family protein n=1 Tax=Roseovarius autotrophicus TaxID=2824121 RepID=UPI0019DFD1F6|nr:YceI family protein [Roseovarius autotrophicus]MBE0452611.1 YceI family protein [Roseovarius sp.]